jgi:hypothetical protein
MEKAELKAGDMCKIIEIEATDGLSQYNDELKGQKVRFRLSSGVKQNGFMKCIVVLPEDIGNGKIILHAKEQLFFTGVKLKKVN